MLKRVALLVLLASVVSGCQHMGTSEYGVIFRKMPPQLGGGVGSRVAHPGETVFVMPWDSVYRFDTSVKSIEFGSVDPNSGMESGYVQTRALDGNEVALAVKIQYRIDQDPKLLVRLVQEVGTSDEEIAELVSAVARADIRTYMNELKTSEFFQNDAKYRGEQRVKKGLEERLRQYGIDIQNVNLKEHRFERTTADGSIDRSYQERINDIQTIAEQTKREILRKETVRAHKQRELNDMQGEYDRTLEEAKGYKEQAELRGEGYYSTKKNEADAILASGKAEVEGMIAQMKALDGPGGEAMLKLELGKQLLAQDPKFVVLGDGGSGNGNLEVRRVDTNEILQQLGVYEGMKENSSNKPRSMIAEEQK